MILTSGEIYFIGEFDLKTGQRTEYVKIGIVRHGAFDGAIGDFSRYEKTLKAMRNTLTVPILLIGLAAPKTFRVQARSQKNSPYLTGEIVPIVP